MQFLLLLKLNENFFELLASSVLISYPISPLRRRENKTRTFWSQKPIPEVDTAMKIHFCFGETWGMLNFLKCLENICFIQVSNFCLQQNVQGHWNSSKLVNREDGLQKQFWMLRDFPENWQFRLSQFCMARNSILMFTSKLQNGRDVSAKSWKSVILSKISFVVICSFCLEISLKISL